jgi:type IV pilus assembly protein PilW
MSIPTKSNRHLRKAVPKPARQNGYSLIELMVSIALGLIIVAGLLTIFVNSKSASNTNQRTSEIQTNGRFAIDILKADLRASGFRGFSWAEPNTPTTTLTPISNECLDASATPGSFVSNIRQGIWGTKNSNPFSANCIPTAHYARGDILVIRKLSSLPTTSLDPNHLYFRTNYAAGELFRGAPTTACASPPQSGYASPYNKVPCIAGNPGVDVLNFPVEIHVYFIRPYTDSPTESPLTPALCRVTLQGSGTSAFIGNEEVVASGIENMRVQYARTLTDQTTQYFDADSINGGSSATGITEWDDVNAARIWLLARNTNTEPGYSNTTTYSLGGSSYPVATASAPNGDSYRRQMFNTVVQLRN